MLSSGFWSEEVKLFVFPQMVDQWNVNSCVFACVQKRNVFVQCHSAFIFKYGV